MHTKQGPKAWLSKIISGGQTGTDMGALVAARALGLESGGFAPKGWWTEDGPQEAILRGFGLIECEEPGYPARTQANVANSDGTLLVGDHQVGGSRLTRELAAKLKKPLFLLAFEISGGTPPVTLRASNFDRGSTEIGSRFSTSLATVNPRRQALWSLRACFC